MAKIQKSAQTAAQEGVPMQFDFRSVYASLLIDWLGAKEDAVREVLFDDFQKIPFIKDCSAPSATDDTQIVIQANVAPNPCHQYTYLNFVNTGKHVNVTIFDAIGSQLEVIANKTLSTGAHEIQINTQSFTPGSYFVRIAMDQKVKTLKFVKRETVRDVARFIQANGRVPDEVWIGAQSISPQNYLATLVPVIENWKDDGNQPVMLRTGNFTADRYVAEDSTTLWGWVIFPEGFHAPKIMEMARLQAWTLKPALLSR